ncbi:MAG: GNAT family N-acetyltransferase [Thermoplasmatota archaeon]
MQLRDATPDDVPALVALARRAAVEASGLSLEQRTVWAERLNEARLSDLLQVAGLRVADDEGPVGFACRIADTIEMLYVDPRAQRRGIGKALLRDLERAAHAGGVHRLRLVTASNAVGFYAARGYEVVREAVEVLDGVNFTRIYMAKG